MRGVICHGVVLAVIIIEAFLIESSTPKAHSPVGPAALQGRKLLLVDALLQELLERKLRARMTSKISRPRQSECLWRFGSTHLR